VRRRTLAAPFTWDADPVKGSRFRAVLVPVTDAEAAQAAVRAVEAGHPDADHCCWAWRLRDGSSRTWDAAEPRGSAGRPILQQLEGHGVSDLLAVVLRQFGGTKLGVGGLMRAYGGTAGMALDRAPLVEVADTVDLVVEHDYADTSPVEAVLAGASAATVSTGYDTRVRRVIRVEAAAAEGLIDALRDRTAGRVVAVPDR
jgi:putative IMPACT (imprinted ancient) family translation regulator